MTREYQVCKRCVMDTSVPDIVFNKEGICNYCSEFIENGYQILNIDPLLREKNLAALIRQIKLEGRNKRYDCIIGVSGGVDSSWALVQAVQLGLRPLAVHMDNGWNSELAQNNISNLVTTLSVDLYTHVIDWEEYRKLMQAFFDANVIDVELLYDNAMLGVNYQQAAKYGIKYILSGNNMSTEGMRMPTDWNWFKRDKKNIKAIGKKHGNVKINSFPAIGVLDTVWYEKIRGIKWVPFLDYFDYNKQRVLEVLKSNYYYKPYPFKHYESIFTRFYQGFILPEKFGVDKRRLHLSTLVISDQITREDALQALKGIAYESFKTLEEDKLYFKKKMGWSSERLEKYVQEPARSHMEYPSELKIWQLYELYNAAAKNPKKAFTRIKSISKNLLKSK